MPIRHATVASAWGAIAVYAALGCSSAGPHDAVATANEPAGLLPAANAGASATGARTSSPAFAEDTAGARALACTAFPQYSSQHLAALLGRPLPDQRGGTVEGHDACSFFGDGLRVRFVTNRAGSAAAARSECQRLAGSGAQLVLGAGSASWVTAGGVHTAHSAECTLTQVFDHGALDTAASLRIAQDTAFRQM